MEATLPLMGGARLCAAIRSDERLKNVSMIMIDDGTEASLAQCQEARTNAVISKPLDRVQLFSRVSELLIVPQRQDIRSLLHVSVVGEERNSSFLGVSSNISISGLLLETEKALRKGDRITCAVTIGGREITGECVVMRVEKSTSDKFLYGIKFMNLDMKSLIIIEQFVKGRIKQE
jgi:CheY-like chemotaxis protein